MAQIETQIRKLVGRIGDVTTGEYYVCDYIFNEGPNFRGATATILTPVSLDRRNAGRTAQSLQDWYDGDEAVFDLSGSEYWDDIRKAEPELTDDSYPIFECIGGGRSFDKDMQFDRVYDAVLLQQIQEIET